MDLVDLFLKVKNEYHSGPYKGNEVADALRHVPKQSIPEYIFPKKNFFIKGSAGQSDWAGIPWIFISDNNITKSAQKGLYIVYLFDSNYDQVYLCLGTGWTYFQKKYKAEAQKNIVKFTRYVKSKINSIDELSRFNGNSIDLNPDGKLSKPDLAKGYEAGTIYSRKYQINERLTNEEILSDLTALKMIFREVVNSLGINDFDDFENEVSRIIGIDMNEIDALEFEKSAQFLDVSEISSVLEPSSIPDIKAPVNSSISGNLNVNKKDHVKEASDNSKLGRSGEEIAIKFEQKRLLNEGYSCDSIRIIDLPKSHRDNAGYDIESIATNIKGESEIRYIEVKTTAAHKETPFFMSQNELNVRKRKADEYYIYRIFDLKKNTPGIYIVPNNSEVDLGEQPITYAIYPSNNKL